jgi:hypothetical protein
MPTCSVARTSVTPSARGFSGQVRGRTVRQGDRDGKTGNGELGYLRRMDNTERSRLGGARHAGIWFRAPQHHDRFHRSSKEAGEPAPVRVLRMIVRKLFLELHGIIGLKRPSRPIP